MRPTRIELAGFGSFREPSVVDFTDAELFVLVGPTGAGKSTVIDALIFALYGSVPRYDDRRLVAPVINQGRLEAKVRLDFVVDDAGYTAVRVVRRTQTGATTKEARLERFHPADPDGHRVVLAGNEKELTERIERLLGLSFDHFTRCVVLPQGAFAQFLHARSSERQNLLVDLLGIDVYRAIGRRARERARQTHTRIEHVRGRLSGELADATPVAVERAATRVAQLEEVHARIVAAQPELEALTERGAQLRAAASAAAERASLLDGLARPNGVDALAQRVRDAEQAHADGLAALDKAEQQRQAAEDGRAALPDGMALAELAHLVASRDDHHARLDPARAALTAAAREHEQAGAARAAAHENVEGAVVERERVRRADLARTLAHGLGAGDDCPVCARPLDDAPHHDAIADLDAAEAAVADAERTARRADETARSAELAQARCQAELERLTAEHAALAERVDALVARIQVVVDDLPAVRDAVAAADRDVAAARADERAARDAVRAAARAVDRLAGDRTAAWHAFDAARDRLATLEPPPVDRRDLSEAWDGLLAWADDRRPALAREAQAATRAVTDAVERYRACNGALVAACRDVGVDVDGTTPLAACAAALERARADRVQRATALETAERLRAEVRDDERLADTATVLGRHLGTRRFEQWLLNQALAQLVADASIRLRELSSQAYSLQVDDNGTFLVVDHRNADELRSARTLSGGETFLASLSLALSLADHVAQLATGTSARLDALFLDEGFGTLDHDTLDVVASALEELGAQGRTVGLVTHVRDLAERMPVRFEVRRTGETSTVARVDV